MREICARSSAATSALSPRRWFGFGVGTRADEICCHDTSVSRIPKPDTRGTSSSSVATTRERRMFDQANPETPNAVIIAAIRRRQPALVGLSFLSTTSYPYAKILARQIRAAAGHVRLAFWGLLRWTAIWTSHLTALITKEDTVL